MDFQDLQNLSEAYNGVYEQQIGIPLKDASDRAAREQLKKMIPKGEKIYTPKSSLQNASYEPDAFDIILEYLIVEGYADTNENALVIMANMSEEWIETIIEGYLPWDFGPKQKAKEKYNQLASRKASEQQSGVRGGRGTATRANRIASVAKDMRTTLDKDSAATGTDPRRQGLQPSTQRHTSAAMRGAGGGQTARRAYQVRPLGRGGGSSAAGVGSASGSRASSRGYQIGGSRGYGISGIRLADHYENEN